MKKTFYAVGVDGVGAFGALPAMVWVVAMVSDAGEFLAVPYSVCPDAVHLDAMNYLLFGGRAFDASQVTPVSSAALDFSGIETNRILLMW